jgi:hypothetical protein
LEKNNGGEEGARVKKNAIVRATKERAGPLLIDVE